MRLLCFVLGIVLSAAGAGVAAPPPVGVDFDYQLGGVRSIPDEVGVVVRDRRAAPIPGRYNICYVNGFQAQPDEKRFWRKRSDLLLKQDGRFVRDEEWNERIFDIRGAGKRKQLARVVGRWIQRCADDGFDAVEFDNLDSFSRSRGQITKRQAKSFARKLVRRAHRAGLAAAQKNWPGLRGSHLGFDLAIAEECGRYDECGRYVATYGRRVLVIEYRRKDFRRTCAEYGDRLAVVLRDRALSADGRRAWC